jgi:hypothetical protein
VHLLLLDEELVGDGFVEVNPKSLGVIANVAKGGYQHE